METQPNSEQSADSNESELSNQQNYRNGNSDVKKSTGRDYHNYAPRHSNHGRLNIRTFGSDHEPGTLR